ncbi:ATP-binding protein [Sphingomonas sp. HF-S3]|uniref:histidine kinase n=1 Tax=Sphingomonas rustica TaxID=3103142 RepID=A0ABV0BDD4_9SPHN
MRRLRVGGAEIPLFQRIFLVMLACVVSVQLLNLMLLLVVPAPDARITTIGQIERMLLTGSDPQGNLKLVPGRKADEGDWTPRVDRIRAAMIFAFQMPADAVELSFPSVSGDVTPVFDRSRIPPPTLPRSRADARDVVIVGDFIVSARRPDGQWVTVTLAHGGFDLWRWRGVLWLGFAALAVLPFAWALARRLAKPIGVFAQAAERLGRDPRAAPLDLKGPPEIGEAAQAFNRMQARLNRYVDDRSTMIAAIAHDLRTPLMRLELRLENAPDDIRHACENDVRDMEAMITAALAFVRDTSRAVARRPLDLRSLAENVTDDLADRGEPVTLAPGDPIVVEGNVVALKALLSNLIGNALKYAGSAEVTLSGTENQAVIEVRDHGPGIPSQDIDRVFEAFFRGDRSRNRDTGGIGLGLASVRAVALAHGGDATVENHPDGGLLARVTLPA